MAKKYGKRWLKGHSCVSNPQTTKYREKAKSCYFVSDKSSEPSGLTVDALSKHNEAFNENIEDVTDDTQSLGNLSIETFAENWSKCGNPTFNRFFKAFDASSNIHKELLSVLAAITEVIKSQNGRETDTEYFAALMITLESLEELDSVIAVVILMRMLCKRLPHSVLKLKFSEVSKILIGLLDRYSDAESTLLIKEILRCLTVMLRVQELAVWKNSSTLHIYQLILNYTIHTKPKIRKEGLSAVSSILHSYYILGKRENGSEFHPASVTTANFAIQQIEECGGAGDTTVILYMLSLLRGILGILPSSSVKKICETILRLMTFGNTIITYQAIQTLLGMFNTRPTISTLPTKLNAQLINALYDYRPSLTDSRSLVSWLLLMQEAHINLWRHGEELCLSNIPRIFQTCVQCWLSEHKETQTTATKTLKNLLYGIVQPLGSKQADVMRTGSSPLVKMFQVIENALKFQFHAVLDHVLHVLAVFFEVSGEHCKALMSECLKSLADLRETESFAYKNELDYAVGMAVRHMGPQFVLDSIPLQLIGSGDTCNLNRSWLLPVIRDYIQETELKFFISYFCPLAIKCQEKALELSKNGPTAASSTYNLIEGQIWSLLPGFCSKPIDLVESFRNIAKLLGKMLKERPELRLYILSSLRLLINKNEDNERNIQELAKYSKNYLPILFNLFTDEPANINDKGSRLSAYETIKIYLKISDVQLCYTLFEKAVSKLEEPTVDNFKRQAVTDLMRTLLPYLDEGRIDKLFKIASSYYNNQDRTLQKKAYHILSDILSETSENCKIYRQKTRTAFEKLLFHGSPVSTPSTKAIRLHCFIILTRLLPNPNKAFVSKVVPEAVLCIKEPSQKTHSKASALLIEIGNTLLRWNEKPKEEILKEYIQLLIAGLAGSSHIISSTLDSLICIIQQFKDIVTSDILSEIAQHVCKLLASRNKEIINSAIAFVTLLISVEYSLQSSPYLLELVKLMINVGDEVWKSIRFKIKPLLEKLIRKIGFEEVDKLFPDKRRKMLVHVRKLQERAKRKRAMKSQAKLEQIPNTEESIEFTKAKTEALEDILQDSEDDDDDDVAKKLGSKKESSAWLSEGFEDNIVDFLDPKIVQNISATQPKLKSSDDHHGFKLSEDGKLIIVDPEEQKTKLKKDPEDVEDSNLYLEAVASKSKQNKNKRKFDDDSDEEKDESSVKYHAGGSGIHRPVINRQAQKKPDLSLDYKAKRAGGDVKRKGRPDPYTYIPLNVSYLNRRKQAKIATQFSGLIKGARKGAQKGKQRRFNTKRK